MLMQDRVWQRIRHHFDEVEKMQLREASTGEAICPRGVFLDESKVPAELLAKLKEHVTK